MYDYMVQPVELFSTPHYRKLYIALSIEQKI